VGIAIHKLKIPTKHLFTYIVYNVKIMKSSVHKQTKLQNILYHYMVPITKLGKKNVFEGIISVYIVLFSSVPVFLLWQYPIDGAADHIEMAQRVIDCDYLCPDIVSDDAQDVVNKVSTATALMLHQLFVLMLILIRWINNVFN